MSEKKYKLTGHDLQKICNDCQAAFMVPIQKFSTEKKTSGAQTLGLIQTAHDHLGAIISTARKNAMEAAEKDAANKTKH